MQIPTLTVSWARNQTLFLIQTLTWTKSRTLTRNLILNLNYPTTPRKQGPHRHQHDSKPLQDPCQHRWILCGRQEQERQTAQTPRTDDGTTTPVRNIAADHHILSPTTKPSSSPSYQSSRHFGNIRPLKKSLSRNRNRRGSKTHREEAKHTIPISPPRVIEPKGDMLGARPFGRLNLLQNLPPLRDGLIPFAYSTSKTGNIKWIQRPSQMQPEKCYDFRPCLNPQAVHSRCPPSFE